MRYGLRTLLIALILGPPILAWLVWPAARPFVYPSAVRDDVVRYSGMVNAEWTHRKGKDGVLILEPPPPQPPGTWKFYIGKDGEEVIEAAP